MKIVCVEKKSFVLCGFFCSIFVFLLPFAEKLVLRTQTSPLGGKKRILRDEKYTTNTCVFSSSLGNNNSLAEVSQSEFISGKRVLCIRKSKQKCTCW